MSGQKIGVTRWDRFLHWAVFGLVMSVTLMVKAADFTVSAAGVASGVGGGSFGSQQLGAGGIGGMGRQQLCLQSRQRADLLKNSHRVTKCGDNWFEIDGPGTSWYDLWTSGFLSGVDLRIYRLVDKDGKSLPVVNDYLDIDKADHPILVGTTKIIPVGAGISRWRLDRRPLCRRFYAGKHPAWQSEHYGYARVGKRPNLLLCCRRCQ